MKEWLFSSNHRQVIMHCRFGGDVCAEANDETATIAAVRSVVQCFIARTPFLDQAIGKLGCASIHGLAGSSHGWRYGKPRSIPSQSSIWLNSGVRLAGKRNGR